MGLNWQTGKWLVKLACGEGPDILYNCLNNAYNFYWIWSVHRLRLYISLLQATMRLYLSSIDLRFFFTEIKYEYKWLAYGDNPTLKKFNIMLGRVRANCSCFLLLRIYDHYQNVVKTQFTFTDRFEFDFVLLASWKIHVFGFTNECVCRYASRW